jgi:hypothetical protein
LKGGAERMDDDTALLVFLLRILRGCAPRRAPQCLSHAPSQSRASHGVRSVLRVCAYAYVEHFRLRLVSAHAVAARVSLDPCTFPLCIGRGMHARGMHACGRRSAGGRTAASFPSGRRSPPCCPLHSAPSSSNPRPLALRRALALALTLTHARTLARAHAREHTRAPASSACARTQVRRVGARAAGWTATRSRGGRGAYPRATAAVLQCCVYCRGTESTDAYGAKASTAARQTRAAQSPKQSSAAAPPSRRAAV